MGHLAADLERVDVLRDPGWRDAYWRVPRHRFIPEVMWVDRDRSGAYAPVHRDDDPELWWGTVYSNSLVVTQVDDGRSAPSGAGGAYLTSSASQPSLVFGMLRALGVTPGMRVLEIGTGTGYNAALLAARLSDRGLTTIEIDGAVGERARAALAGAGWHPAVIVGDGAEGYPPNAPYDRVIATCAVRRVPYAWIDQTRPGGVILTPWGTAYHNGALLRLVAGAGGTATGSFDAEASFMWIRAQRTPPLGDIVHREKDADHTVATLDPGEVFAEQHAEFAVGLRVPDCGRLDHAREDGGLTRWLFDPATASWAGVDYRPGAASHPVAQYGPRRLWDEVEHAYHWWCDRGRPERERFGVTVTAERQCLWLDEPAREISAPRPLA
ncbi:MAG: methyltransferase domain-containing protein [Streptosporangiaceae bacterium]